jgi:Flp pilus assembly protein TadD
VLYDSYTQAISLNPGDGAAYNNRGLAYYDKGRYDKAIADFIQAISLNSNDDVAYNNISWLLASCPDDKHRNGVKAIEFAKKALDLKPDDPENSDTLAMAYAEAGRFEDAVKTQEKAIEMLKKNNNDKKLSEYTERLNSYKANKPWREMPSYRNNHAE